MRWLASAREPTFNNNDTAEIEKKGAFKYKRPEAMASFVVLLKNERQKNEHRDYGYIPPSHRKARGADAKAGVLFYAPAIWQSPHAAESA
jgi:hypothetical protein